jgi:hypothetical protein
MYNIKEDSYCSLVHDIMQSGRWVPTFQRNILASFSDDIHPEYGISTNISMNNYLMLDISFRWTDIFKNMPLILYGFHSIKFIILTKLYL